ncbi:MAG: hypothetical protein MUC47_04100 [Candidatus Kapabacteria bacterium]|nr:hypothetical protein [Candidatus Kapabacteria bacterium]
MKSRLLRGLASFGAALATLGTISLQAQNTYPRLGLVEQFTSATCGPCVAAGPVMARVVQLRDNYVSIRYHMNFPAPGDPWNVLNPGENEARQLFYGVNGIPTARVNGKSEADPRNEGALTGPLIADKNAKSPAYITVVQDGGKVKVKVWSNIALNAHRLHVAMVSRSTTVPELANLPNNNGERTFGDAMLDMLTGPQGQSITIAANGTQEFEFPVQLGTGSLWPSNQQYVIAFIQADGNREVIQAGTMRSSQDSTQFAFIRPTSVNASIAGDVYGKVARGATTTREITFTNTSSTAVKVTPSVNDQATLTQIGWTVSFQPSGEVTVPANGTAKVTVSIQAPANRSVFSTFNLAYTADDGAGRSILPFNLLVEGARLAMYYGTSDAEPVILAAQSVLGVPSIAADAVLLPYNTQANQAYPWSSFEGALFTFNGFGQLGSSGAISTIKNMLAAGKKVWVSAELEMSSNFNTQLQQIWNQEARDWFGTTLGLTYVGLLDFVSQNQLIRFTANGTGNSVIGNGITVNGHAEYSANWPYYQRYVDIWTINPGSPSREQFTIPVNSQQGQINAVVGITYETSTGGKLYYSSLSMLPISTAATRNSIATNVINWMFQAPQPAVGLSAQQINFRQCRPHEQPYDHQHWCRTTPDFFGDDFWCRCQLVRNHGRCHRWIARDRGAQLNVSHPRALRPHDERHEECLVGHQSQCFWQLERCPHVWPCNRLQRRDGCYERDWCHLDGSAWQPPCNNAIGNRIDGTQWPTSNGNHCGPNRPYRIDARPGRNSFWCSHP